MSSVVREARLSESPLSIDRLFALVNEAEVGGVALFVGVVRNHDGGSDVVSLDYTAHPSAEQSLRRCADQVAQAYAVRAVAVTHRIGHLRVGDLAVVIAVGADHRGPALAACQALIDTVKAEVPIWKEQEFVGGGTQWVGLPAPDPAATP